MWVMMSIASALTFAGMLLLFKHVQNSGVAAVPLLLVLFFMVTGMYTAHAYIAQVKFEMSPKIIGWIFLAAILSYLSNYFSVTAMGIAPNPGYVTAICSGAAVVVAVASVWLFGSELGAKEIVGALLVLLGLVLLTI